MNFAGNSQQSWLAIGNVALATTTAMAALVYWGGAGLLQGDDQERLATPTFELIRTYPAKEAHQAVAVDAEAFYVISNRRIGKYSKATGEQTEQWEGPKDGPIQHLNSGVVIDGRLVCAHSNYPNQPMLNSVEIWRTEDLRHVSSHSFGIADGSLTWVDRHAGFWWACFAHYGGQRAVAGRGPAWTQVVQMDDDWRRSQAWVFPPQVVERIQPMSVSGGSWGPDGLLYAAGHDRKELYLLRLPRSGFVMEWIAQVPSQNAGQGIAWDRSASPDDGAMLWGIQRLLKTVVVVKAR